MTVQIFEYEDRTAKMWAFGGSDLNTTVKDFSDVQSAFYWAILNCTDVEFPRAVHTIKVLTRSGNSFDINFTSVVK